MHRRFLNDNDYLGIITREAIDQLTRGDEQRFSLVEEAAEASIIEYLTDNYEIEKELAVGKNLMEYNNQITYPAGTHFYKGKTIYKTLRAINGIKTPNAAEYWAEFNVYDEQRIKDAKPYSQLLDFSPGDIVSYANTLWECLEYNGFSFNDIRIPGINAWEQVEEVPEWTQNVEYEVMSPVSYKGEFYALLNNDDIDLTINPEESDNWGLIGEYDKEYHYELSKTEYVKFNGGLWIPVMSPVSDELIENYNIVEHDPRNPNIKKHMVRLALYELHKLISPNNVSSSRIADYEASISWLRDANRLRINPQIQRKLDDENKPVAEFAIATFMRDYDPYKNPWQI